MFPCFGFFFRKACPVMVPKMAYIFIQSGISPLILRAPKNVQKNSLFFIFVDEFQKIIRCFLFPLIFSTNSTNQRNQRNEFNESTKKIFVDLTKFQRIFNENFNESTKISTNSTKISTNQRKFQRIQRKFQRITENFEKSTKISFVDSLNSLTNFQINIYSLISVLESTKSTNQYFYFQRNEFNE